MYALSLPVATASDVGSGSFPCRMTTGFSFFDLNRKDWDFQADLYHCDPPNNTPGTGLRQSYVLLDGQAGRPPPPNPFPSPVTRVWRMGAGKRGLECGLTALQALVYDIRLPWWLTLLHSYFDQPDSP